MRPGAPGSVRGSYDGMDLKGKIAWVTGAGTGIGDAGAVALAREGATVVLTGRRAGPLEAVAAAIKTAGGAAHVQAADLTKPAAVEKVVGTISKDLGRLDVLVNNAGVNIPDRTWARLTSEGIDTLLQG